MQRFTQIGLASLIQPRVLIGQEPTTPNLTFYKKLDGSIDITLRQADAQQSASRGEITDPFLLTVFLSVIYLPFTVPVPPAGHRYEILTFGTWTIFPKEETGWRCNATSVIFELSDPVSRDISIWNSIDEKTQRFSSSSQSGSFTAESRFLPVSPGTYMAKLEARKTKACLRPIITDASILVTLRLVKIPPIVDFVQPFQAQPQTSVSLEEVRTQPLPLAQTPSISPPRVPEGTKKIRSSQVAPVPQNGLSASRVARFGQVVFGQRDIGFPVSPVSRSFMVPQSVPDGPAVYQGPVVERLPEQVALDPSAIRRPVNPLFQKVPQVLPARGQGYTGPGTYRVIAPNGLRTFVRDYTAAGGSSRTRPVPNLPTGTILEITGDVGGGWLLGRFDEAEVVVEAPGGAGLLRQNSFLNPLERGRPYRNRPVPPVIRGIGGYGRPIG